jgi:uncharacterized protein YecT (DUF1311 family)
MTKLSAVLIIALGLVSQSADAQSTTAEPYELTSRGTIAFDANQRYKSAIEDCFNGEPGFAPSGEKFLACLERETHIQDAALNEIYRGAVGYLKGSPAKISRLQETQRAWLHYREANCAFARSIAPPENSAEFFYDCVLRSIVERQAELRNFVAD